MSTHNLTLSIDDRKDTNTKLSPFAHDMAK